MSNLVVVATSDLALRQGISTRLLHPAIGLTEIEYLEDAAELAAFLSTTEVGLVLIDPTLPKLNKSLLKQVNRNHELMLVTAEVEHQRIRFGFKLTEVSLANLISGLRDYRVTDQTGLTEPRAELMLVGAVASGSGSTSVALNLALQMSRQKNVMLVDFDLTHPSLAAQIQLPQSPGGLTKVMQLVTQGELTPAELALNCASISPTLRLLPGSLDLSQFTELDLSLVEEIIDVAVQLDDVVILDLGQLISFGLASQLQQLLVAISNQLLLVCAADPISMLTSCNWLSSSGKKFQSKLQIVINKLDQKSSAAELANLVSEAINAKPVVYLPMAVNLFRQAVWSGKILSDSQPKSEFARTISRWLNQSKATNLPVSFKNKKGLERLRQVS